MKKMLLKLKLFMAIIALSSFVSYAYEIEGQYDFNGEWYGTCSNGKVFTARKANGEYYAHGVRSGHSINSLDKAIREACGE